MRKNYILFACVIAIALASFFFFNNYKSQQTDFASQQETTKVVPKPTVSGTPTQAAPEYRGPLDDCLQNSFLYTRLGDMIADCTMNYVHFYPSSAAKKLNLQKRPAGELKIGSFNLFHMGDNQAPLKNFALIASIINRWDIVGGQEFMPLAGDIATNNSILGQLVQDQNTKPIQFPYQNWRVVAPGYLRLLQELQKLDSSWALILQSTPAGEGSTGEMAGFFYRSSSVELKEWDYCPSEKTINIKNNAPAKNLGCLVQVTEDRKKLISRTAFAAYFKSGNFDFVGLTSHIRFRADDDAGNRKTQMDEICLNNTDVKKCSLPQDAIGRFYEVLAVAEQIASIKEKAKDKDVIFMGDFNLEILPKTIPYWKAALKKATGFMAFQTDPSTLSAPAKKLASNYDHFIFDPKQTTACDSKTAHTYNLTASAKANNDPVLQKIGSYLKPETQQQWIVELTKNLDTLVHVQNKGDAPVRALNDKEKKDYTDTYAEVFKRMQGNDYAVWPELISDHIPIEMSCRTDLPMTQ